MRERIIGYLHGISEGTEPAFLLRARSFMIRNAHMSDEQLAQRAKECFDAMLLDFDNVHIQTIDSFLQTLLAGLAGVLRMSAGLNTELDVDHVIRQSVDQLLTSDMTPADRSILEDYMRLKLDQESHWDIRQSLCMMAKELYNESVQMLEAEGRILFNAELIARRRETLEQSWSTNENLKALRDIIAHCDPTDYNRYTTYAYERLKRSIETPEDVQAKDRFRGVSEKSCNDEQMGRATEIAQLVARDYNTLQLTIRFSRDMELMSSLEKLINRNLDEANCALLAKTASTLTKALKEGDADFILEKAGIRYHHILIDEFQDTSMLQWNVIRQLVQDVLAGVGNTLLIVGDIKQSIYRWRNGDWHIMASLGTDLTHYSEQINKAFPNLTRNFRSSENVVNFNLSLFKHIIEHYPHHSELELIQAIYDEGFKAENLSEFYQSDKKKGGYVRFRAFPKGTKEDLALDMFNTMEDLLKKGVKPSDMMVLVREKKEAALITDLKATLSDISHPLLSEANIVSADSFVLEASEHVRLIIAGLQYIVRDDVLAAKMIEMSTGDPSVLERLKQTVNVRTPLYRAVNEIIHILLANDEGVYDGSEVAYVNNLLDRTRDYVGSYGSNLDDFLTYWDDTLHAKPIPAATSNAIRILTVHASKGLQAQTLFVPFCMWSKESGRIPQKVWCEVSETLNAGNDYVPIVDGTEMEESHYIEEHRAEHLNMRVDNLNMLYVALTRAEDNLFISTAYPVTSKGVMGTCNHVGRYIMDFAEQDEYEVGKVKVKGERLKEEGSSLSEATHSIIQSLIYSDSSQVRFVQSQEGALYTDYGDEAYRRVARIDEGTLCHEIFANIRKADDLDHVLDLFMSRGEIKSSEQREQLRELISSSWEGNEQMKNWFTAPWELKLEEPIYIDHRELRPDRVMINPLTNEAIVLDYKFGGWDSHYNDQVNDYMRALTDLGYSPVHGYLWFARDNKLIPVKRKA